MFRSSSRYAQYARWNEVRRRTGYRSQYEADIAAGLTASGVSAAYEAVRLPYSVTLSSTYTPDWILPEQCIVLEAKGAFSKADRDKMELIKSQYPHLDIRMVLQHPTARLTPKARMTLADWCDARDFPWCGGPQLPEAWLRHRPGVRARKAFEKLTAGK